MAIYASALFGNPYTADISLKVLAQGSALIVRSSAIATRFGMPKGASVLLNSMSHAQRDRFCCAQKDMPISAVVSYKGTIRRVIVPATLPIHAQTPFQKDLELAAMTFALLLAGYLGFRLPGLMIAALIFFLGGGGIIATDLVSLFARLPDLLYTPMSRLSDDLVNWFPVFALACFAVRLPGGATDRTKRAIIWAVDGIAAVAFLVGLINSSAHSLAWAMSAGAVLLGASIFSLCVALPQDRGRVGIVFAGVIIGGTGYLLSLASIGFLPETFDILFFEASVMLVPLSVFYAMLRHRVFDVGFALNRTLVYAITSAAVLLAFAGLEFIAERFVSALTHVEGLALQFGIALAIIVCVRLVHGRADRLVDSLLFRTRHEQESALRRFASTLQFYTESSPLIGDTVEAMIRYARVKAAALYVVAPGKDGLERITSSFEVAASRIDYNDAALVELRAHGDVLQARGLRTGFPGERLYPMMLAGRVSGALALSERQSSEEMPPDIDDAVRQVVQSVAITLAAIEAESVRREIASLQARLAAPGGVV